MKNSIFRKLGVIILSFSLLISCNCIYGISDNFKFVIDTIGIPRYNVYGKEINEEIYKAYNVFVYGNPEDLTPSDGQRWKDSKYGLWSKGVGAYNGYGTRGEYNLLGRDYSGNIVNNYYFPVDTLPTDTPEYWNYYSNPGAAESWKDKNKYKYDEQLQYMKNTKLLFNDISSKDNSDNPEKIKEYNITASKIGLDKARLDVCSTWKTNGIIHTRRKVGNQIRYAVFLTAPMAANANIKASIDINQDNYTIEKDQDNVEIIIPYGANIVNMTGYANAKHIKEIKSELYINGKKVDEISGSKTDVVGKNYTLTLSRNELLENQNNVIKVVNSSYSHTEFAVDGLMQNNVEKIINIFVCKKQIIPLIFEENNIMILEKAQDDLVVRPLAQYNLTKEAESTGITEAGKYIAIKLKKNKEIKDFDYTKLEVYLDDEKLSDIKLYEGKNNNIGVVIRIPNYTNSSIFGWKSLRELYGNYFNIDSNDIGKRIDLPHDIKLTTCYDGEKNDINLKIDTIDDYVTNINYSCDNISYNNIITNFQEWLDCDE